MYIRILTTMMTAWLLLMGAAPVAHAQYSWASEMREDIRTVLDEHDSEGIWSALVLNLKTNEVMVDYRSEATMLPASTVKVLTSAAALDLLGPDFQYETVLTATGPVRDGCIQGHVVLHGSGDPSFGATQPTASVFTNWAEGLAQTGIECITGNVIGNGTRFDKPSMGPGWSWDDASYKYAAQHSALSYHGNVIDIAIRATPRDEQPRVRWEPDSTSYVTISQQLERRSAGSSLSRSYERLPGQNVIDVEGEIPVGRATRFQVTVDNPTVFSAYVFNEALQRAGVRVEGQATSWRVLDARPTIRDTLTSAFSPPLSDLVQTMNTESNNLYAEQLLHTLGAEAHGDSLDAEGTRERGLHLVRSLIEQVGGDPDRLRLVDGSGLSRYNLISAKMLVRVLAYMHTHPDPDVRRAFVDSLPVGGQNGTLEYRFRRASAARGNVRAKTGTLSNNSSLAGYVTSFEGTPFAFALMANNHVGSTRALRIIQDQIVNILAEYPR
ncbi:MAG: D-alanyl-D-alanine carboxypeptidase/D-alanyl-D-alanine-endopeptidase [Longimonas sp.]|uniref:D-alanyl-D-alanine carboxypeptidase/D-alanyl-D-alanine endopeptidase n=1 Tax=Longimonas sp. TaxID=2039626 RepID=UPI003974F41C